MSRKTGARPHYLARLWRELGRMGGEHDAFIKVIIVERIVKSTVLIVLAIGFIVAGEKGWLDQWADYAENQLNLDVGPRHHHAAPPARSGFHRRHQPHDPAGLGRDRLRHPRGHRGCRPRDAPALG